MKIRNGFVSNSSSASFIVFLPNATKEDVLRKLAGNMHWELDESGECRKRLIEKAKENIERFKDKEYIIAKEESFIEELEESYYTSVMETYLKKHWIDVKQKDGGVIFETWASMYNDFDSMSDTMQLLVTSLAFLNYRMECKIEED